MNTRHPPQTPYFWIIGGGLMQVPLIEVVHALGLRALVTDRRDDCACASLADWFEAVDIFDLMGHLVLCDELLGAGERIAGVLAAGVDAPLTMAVLAQHLGVPGISPDIAALVHHKAKCRKRLTELGYPMPLYRQLSPSDLPDLTAIADGIGYPLIIKNTDSSGSRGTRIFQSRQDEAMHATAREAMRVSRSGTALLESCWEGTEHTVETLFDVHGKFHRCFITDRWFDKSAGFAIETGLRHPSVLSVHAQEQMYSLAEQVARDVGIHQGAAKYDMMMTQDGPRIIEMTVRLSGGFDCQYLVPAATGKQVLRAAVLTALGRPLEPNMLTDTRRRIGVTGSLWPQPGTITRIEGVAQALALPGIEQVFLRCKTGDRVEAYTDCTQRVCFVIATGDDEAQARSHLDRALRTIRIETRPS